MAGLQHLLRIHQMAGGVRGCIRRLTQLALLLLTLDATLCLAEDEIRRSHGVTLAARHSARLRRSDSNPLVQSDDIPIIADFDIAWFGDHWFFDNGDLGLTVADNDMQ